jgi:glycogen synthase
VKVLMLGWEFPPHISGGLGTACQGIVRGLTARGVEVLFVVPRTWGDEDAGAARLLGARQWQEQLDVSDVEEAAGFPAVSEPVAQRATLRVVTVASPLRPYATAAQYAERVVSGVPARESQATHSEQSLGIARPRTHMALSGGYGADIFAEVERYAQVVTELARGETFDVVHAHDWMTFPAGQAVALAAGRPLVAHVHASEYDRAGNAPDMRVAEIERRGLAAAQRVVCVSAYTADLVRRRYGVEPARLRVVHNAVETRRAPSKARAEVHPTSSEPDRTPLVLFLGRVTFQKGPEYFLEAAARVLALEPRARFVICGTGDLLPAVVERAAALGLARRVRFTGFLSRDEVERMFALADVYVMPSVSEPFGIAPLEALAQGVPVIVSRQSGVSEVLESALKVDYWDVAELANKILAVLRRPALRRALSQTARGEMAGLRWETRGERLREVYEELLV